MTKQMLNFDIEIKEFLAFSHELANLSGNFIAPLFRSNLDAKEKGDKDDRISPVTEADRGAELLIRNQIEKHYPLHGINGEEYGLTQGSAEYLWVIDPIDGTDPFLAGLPTWGTLIALKKDNKPLIGMMNQPVFGERFYGSPNGAFLGANRIKTRHCKNLSNANLSITSLKMLVNDSQRSAFFKIDSMVYNRRIGGDCYNYALLAAGFIDLVIEGELAPWDIQAHIPIIEAAGGIITDWKGNPIKEGGWVVAAGDPWLHEEALKILSLAEVL